MKSAEHKVLVIDDEESMRHMLGLVLSKHGYRVTEADCGEKGVSALREEVFEAVLCDIRMPGMDGLAFLKEVSSMEQLPTVIMMSAFGTIDTAVECMKRGAYDYISKPFKPDEVVLTLRKAAERLGLQRENRRLREELELQSARAQFVCQSPAMGTVLAMIGRVADSGSPILITGETGTGKELAARVLHQSSHRSAAPFVAVNCSTISAGLLESELFGHAKGAFTGADRSHQGLFGAASGGTLFLDEIGEMPLELQPKLLRVLQEGEVRPLGETRSKKVDVRILAATAKDLRAEVEAGRFRDDLYYRLDVVQIRLPPLRERKEDIEVLARHFLHEFCRRERRFVPELTGDVLEVLGNYDWPGNVRELRNYMEKALIFCRGDRIDLASLPSETRCAQSMTGRDFSLKQATERLEREYILKALRATGGNRTHAARLLEVSLRSLLYKMKDYGIG